MATKSTPAPAPGEQNTDGMTTPADHAAENAIAAEAADSGLVFEDVDVNLTRVRKPNQFTNVVNRLTIGGKGVGFNPGDQKITTLRSQLDRAVDDRNEDAAKNGQPEATARWNVVYSGDKATRVEFMLVPKITRKAAPSGESAEPVSE